MAVPKKPAGRNESLDANVDNSGEAQQLADEAEARAKQDALEADAREAQEAEAKAREAAMMPNYAEPPAMTNTEAMAKLLIGKRVRQVGGKPDTYFKIDANGQIVDQAGKPAILPKGDFEHYYGTEPESVKAQVFLNIDAKGNPLAYRNQQDAEMQAVDTYQAIAVPVHLDILVDQKTKKPYSRAE